MNKRGRKPGWGYPWDEWFEQGRFVLRRPTHYRCHPTSMVQMIRNAGAKRNLSVAIEATERTLIVTVVGRRRRASAR